MADIFLSFMVEETLARVRSLITNEISPFWNLKGDLKELQKSLTIICIVLQEAEKQQTIKEPIRLWLSKLKDVAYVAEDVFDELAYETLQKKVSNFDPSIKRSFVKKAACRVKMAHKVQNINKLLDKIKNEAMGFWFHYDIPSYRVSPQVDLDRVTDSVIDNPVIGREANVSKIVNLVTHSYDQQLLTIVPIVGMGGLGKTALAKVVCQEVRGIKIFDVKLWVCVSENLNEQKILGEMLQSLNPRMRCLTNRDAILQELENSLGKRRFLLVLDYVWENVFRFWDDLRCRLLKIRDSNVLNTTDNKENVQSILKLSFDNLQSYLKLCFGFCSVFPKDFWVEKEQLIHFWIAEGFVESYDEENDDKYFNALLGNSFFQDVERNESTGDAICKMHDLVHGLYPNQKH